MERVSSSKISFEIQEDNDMDRSGIVAIMSVIVLHCIVCQEQEGGLIRQCLCNTLEPCYEQMKAQVVPCARHCRAELSALGDSRKMMRCVMRKRRAIEGAWNCFVQQSGQYCTTDPNARVARLTLEELKEKALNQALQSALVGPLVHKFQPMLVVVDSFFECTRQCVETNTNYCFANLQCGLQLPDAKTVVTVGKSCATQYGLDKSNICDCITDHMKANLKQMCPFVASQIG